MKFIKYVLLMLCLNQGSLLFSQQSDDIYHAGQLYVKFSNAIPHPQSIEPVAEVKAIFKHFEQDYTITKIKAGFYFSKDELANVYHVYFNNLDKTEALIKDLEKSDGVLYAERIPVSKRYDFPNDLGANSQGANGQYYLYKINAPLAWDIQIGDPNIKVAVVDDAVETTHSEISGLTFQGYDVVDNDFDIMPPSNEWDHGTFISGMITAKTNNGAGMASLARGVRILPIKITDDINSNIIQNEYEGVVFAATQGSHVINMSWGTSTPSQTGLAAMNSAHNSGAVLVAAAGNDNSSLVTYPAAYPHVISVASTTSIDAKSSFSNYGSWIDISAPGTQIWSLLPDNTYGVKSGTSFSAPLVSAAAALLLSNNPSLTPDQVLACLQSSADNIDVFNSSYIGQLGAGRLNVRQALQCVASTESPFEVWLNQVISPEVTSCETEITPQIRVVNFGSDTIFSMNIRWQIDNSFFLTQPWADTLLPGDAKIISLPTTSHSVGHHQLNVTILDTLNGSFVDAYPSNNSISYSFQINPSSGLVLPFVESFESGSFTTNNWSVINQGSDYSWEIANTSGTLPGSKSARLPYYLDFETGVKDYLISPTLNFSGFSNVTLTYDYAYMQRTAGVTDSLKVSVSDDCGQTWVNMISYGEGSSPFATIISNGTFFVPQLEEDWCGGIGDPSCGSIDLSGFDGMSGIRIRFEGLNANGNNIYIDNINVSGTPTSAAPISSFDAEGNLQVCKGQLVAFNNTSMNAPQNYDWSFPGATITSSAAVFPVVMYDSVGTFDVQLIVANAFGTDTLLIPEYITVLDLPNVSVIINPDTICRGQSATLTAQGADLYYWNAGLGLPSSNLVSVTASPTTTSYYTVTGWAQSTCTNSFTKPLIVLNPPAAPVITTDNATLTSSTAANYLWYVNGVEIENSDSITITPNVNGNYNVRIYDAYGCSAISIPFTVNFVGIEDVDQIDFTLSPNPANDLVKIQSSQHIELAQLYQVNGKLIQSINNKNASKELQMNTSEISEGFYLIRVSGSFGIKTMPLVIVR
jgi:serine protease